MQVFTPSGAAMTVYLLHHLKQKMVDIVRERTGPMLHHYL
jgi:hypothetical protein